MAAGRIGEGAVPLARGLPGQRSFSRTPALRPLDSAGGRKTQELLRRDVSDRDGKSLLR